MTKPLTATHLRAQLFKTLDRVVATGKPVEVARPAGTVRIVAATTDSRLARLAPHPGAITGDAGDLAKLGWSNAWRPTL